MTKSKEKSIDLSASFPAYMDILHPFYLIFDKNLQIVQKGPLLKKLCPKGQEQITFLPEMFTLERPRMEWNFQGVQENISELYILKCMKGLLLKGQMISIENDKLIAFIASPMIASLAELNSLGLSVEDFPRYDSTADHLFALQNQQISLSELKRLSDEIKRSNMFNSRLLNILNKGIAVFKEADLTAIFTNTSFDKLYGDHFTANRELDEFFAALDSCRKMQINEHKKISYKFHNVFDIEERYIEVNFAKFFDEKIGNVIVTIHDDISLIKKTENRLLESENRHTTIINSAPAAIVSANSAGKIESWNTEAEQIFGYSMDEVVGKDISIIIPQEIRSLHHVKFHGAVASGARDLRNHAITSTGITKKGTRIPVSINIASWRASDQLFFTAVLQDLTVERALGDQLRQAQKLEATGRLASGVAHDFNNLLTVILSVASELENNATTSHMLEQAKLLSNTGLRAAALTRQLLIFSRQEKLKPENMLLHENVAETVLMLQRIIGEHVKIVFKAQPTSLIKVDKGQIGQILLNLVVNARDAMPHGGEINISVCDCVLDKKFADSHEGIREGAYVMLSVKDSGTGISPEHMDRIFDPFFTTKAAGQGTGLGLSMVFGAVRQNNGCVVVKSEINKGTTFEIYFPQERENKEIAKAVQEAELLAKESTDYTILLVEDQADVRFVAESILRKHGYTVIEASNGKEALAKYQEQHGKIDLLLTDLVMPEMGGIEIYENIIQQRPLLPVIFMSGYMPDKDRMSKITDGSLPYLSKPFSRQSLVKMVQDTLRNAKKD